MLFIPKKYNPSPLRRTCTQSNDEGRKRNYIEKIGAKTADEQRHFREKRDLRLLQPKANNTSKPSEFDKEYEDEINCFRKPRFIGACKFYISGVCANGNLCEYMHEDFPCRYYHLGLKHPKSSDSSCCRFKHGGKLPVSLYHYFKNQIKIWVLNQTKDRPELFDSLHTDYIEKFELKQLQLEQQHENTNDAHVIDPSTDMSLSIDSLKSNFCLKEADQINKIPVDDLLGSGISPDQLHQITVESIKRMNCVASGDVKFNHIQTLDSSFNNISRINENPFRGFSETELNKALENLSQIDRCSPDEVSHQSEPPTQENSEDSSDSGEDFNLVIDDTI